MSKLAEELRSWSDAIQMADIEDNIKNSAEQTEINRNACAKKREEKPDNDRDSVLQDVLREMPERFDATGGDRQYADDYIKRIAVPADNIVVAEHGEYSTVRNTKGSVYMALAKDGSKLGVVEGTPGKNNILKVDMTASMSKSTVKGVMYQMFMDILKDGKYILSDTLHSPGAEAFWTKLIQDPKRFVYVVFDRKPQMRATPDKLHKYWGEEGSISSKIQFLLMK